MSLADRIDGIWYGPGEPGALPALLGAASVAYGAGYAVGGEAYSTVSPPHCYSLAGARLCARRYCDRPLQNLLHSDSPLEPVDYNQ